VKAASDAGFVEAQIDYIEARAASLGGFRMSFNIETLFFVAAFSRWEKDTPFP
jgi:hypothetical protein